MATKRKPIRQTLNSRTMGSGPAETRGAGTRLPPEPTTIKESIVMMIMALCRKSLFFNTTLKVGLYLCLLFLVSLIGDFVPFPKTYLARSDNLFNRYFVKVGWGWTLVFTVPYLVMTSLILCCGNIQKMVKHHLPRIVIATLFWFCWTKFFNYIETSYGRCSAKSFYSKSACLKAGYLWRGFDISGHAFILVHSSLVLIEEAKSMNRWESIKEHIRNEFNDRNNPETTSPGEVNPLRNLSTEELKTLKFLYEKFTPIIKLLFIGMAALQVLWDVMLVCTMLYFHKMVEKVLSGIVAILTWYFTYRFWYASNETLPAAVGTGDFLYQNKKVSLISKRRNPSLSTNDPTASTNQIPKFMGMPLYTNPKQPNVNIKPTKSSGISSTPTGGISLPQSEAPLTS